MWPLHRDPRSCKRFWLAFAHLARSEPTRPNVTSSHVCCLPAAQTYLEASHAAREYLPGADVPTETGGLGENGVPSGYPGGLAVVVKGFLLATVLASRARRAARGRSVALLLPICGAFCPCLPCLFGMFRRGPWVDSLGASPRQRQRNRCIQTIRAILATSLLDTLGGWVWSSRILLEPLSDATSDPANVLCPSVQAQGPEAQSVPLHRGQSEVFSAFLRRFLRFSLCPFWAF